MKIYDYLFKRVEVRRYNFIVGTSCSYSGLFRKRGLFGDFVLAKRLNDKKAFIARHYNVKLNEISISHTLKG